MHLAFGVDPRSDTLQAAYKYVILRDELTTYLYLHVPGVREYNCTRYSTSTPYEKYTATSVAMEEESTSPAAATPCGKSAAAASSGSNELHSSTEPEVVNIADVEEREDDEEEMPSSSVVATPRTLKERPPIERVSTKRTCWAWEFIHKFSNGAVVL